MTDEDILAAAEAIQAKKSPEYTERAATIAELAERILALRTQQQAIDDAAEAAKRKLAGPDDNKPAWDISRVGAAIAPDSDIFAVEDDDTFNEYEPRPNGAGI